MPRPKLVAATAAPSRTDNSLVKKDISPDFPSLKVVEAIRLNCSGLIVENPLTSINSVALIEILPPGAELKVLLAIAPPFVIIKRGVITLIFPLLPAKVSFNKALRILPSGDIPFIS